MRRLAAVLISVLACSSHGSTPLTSTWRAPEAAGRLELHRVVAVFVSRDLPMRRSVEDRLAQRIPGSFAAYITVPGLSLADPTLARTQLRNKLFDGAVLVRVVNGRDEPTVRPGAEWYTAYPTFHGYWGSSWTAVREPSPAEPDNPMVVEILVYSVGDDKLLWAGRTTTANARSAAATVDRAADAMVRELWAKRR